MDYRKNYDSMNTNKSFRDNRFHSDEVFPYRPRFSYYSDASHTHNEREFRFLHDYSNEVPRASPSDRRRFSSNEREGVAADQGFGSSSYHGYGPTRTFASDPPTVGNKYYNKQQFQGYRYSERRYDELQRNGRYSEESSNWVPREHPPMYHRNSLLPHLHTQDSSDIQEGSYRSFSPDRSYSRRSKRTKDYDYDYDFRSSERDRRSSYEQGHSFQRANDFKAFNRSDFYSKHNNKTYDTHELDHHASSVKRSRNEIGHSATLPPDTQIHPHAESSRSVPDAVNEPHFEVNPESHGYIFFCTNKTEKECMRLHLFGFPKSYLELVQKVSPGDFLFLFNLTTKMMTGIFQATSQGGLDINPNAFGGSYSAQVKVDRVLRCLKIPEQEFKPAIISNYYSQYKFDTTLNSDQVRSLIRMFKEKKISTKPLSLTYVRKDEKQVKDEKEIEKVEGASDTDKRDMSKQPTQGFIDKESISTPPISPSTLQRPPYSHPPTVLSQSPSHNSSTLLKSSHCPSTPEASEFPVPHVQLESSGDRDNYRVDESEREQFALNEDQNEENEIMEGIISTTKIEDDDNNSNGNASQDDKYVQDSYDIPS